jgi:hypothetical protein
MQAQRAKQHRLWMGLLVSVFLNLWLSASMAQAAPKQDQCLRAVFTAIKSQNPEQDTKDFKADLNKAMQALQNAPNFGNKPAAQLVASTFAIVCHLRDTVRLTAVAAEQQMRLKEAIAKLRNIFQRIVQANTLTEADKIKDWLAKLFFLGPDKFLHPKFKVNNLYIWNLVRLELVLNNAGAAQEGGVFAVPAGGTDVDLIMLGRPAIDSNKREEQGRERVPWPCELSSTQIKACIYDYQDGLFFIQIKDVANANDVLFTQQGGQQVAGGEGTLQHYTEITLKHISANAANWRNAYGAEVVACWYSILGGRLPCPQQPLLPQVELVIGILFWSSIDNADKVKQEVTGLGVARLNNAQLAVKNALNKEVKGVAIGWRTLDQQKKVIINYSCAGVDRQAKTWQQCNEATNPLQLFGKENAARFVCAAFGRDELAKCIKDAVEKR